MAGNAPVAHLVLYGFKGGGDHLYHLSYSLSLSFSIKKNRNNIADYEMKLYLRSNAVVL